MRGHVLIAGMVAFLASCSGGGGGSENQGPAAGQTSAGIVVNVSPQDVELIVGQTLQFEAEVTNTSTGVIWYVNGIRGGDNTVGRINSTGRYTAPDSPPGADAVFVIAESQADSSVTAQSTVTVSRPESKPALLRTTGFAAPAFAQKGFFHDVTVDIDGNVLAAGSVHWGGDQYGFVASMTPFGVENWVYAPDDTESSINRIVVAPDGWSYQAAGNLGGEIDDHRSPALFQLDSAGTLQKTSSCDLPEGESFLSLASDGAGYYMSPFRDTRIFTANPTGTVDCSETIAVPTPGQSDPTISDIIRLEDGFLIGSGRQITNDCWHPGRQIVIKRLSNDGDELWSFDFDGILDSTQTTTNRPRLVVVHEVSLRYIYVAASVSTPRDTACESEPADDLGRHLLVKLDMQGNLIWSKTWDGGHAPSSCEAYSEDLVPDPDGGVLVVGRGNEYCEDRMVCNILSYTPSGEIRWTMRPDISGALSSSRILDYCLAGVLSANGEFLYLAGGDIRTLPWRLFISKVALPINPAPAN